MRIIPIFKSFASISPLEIETPEIMPEDEEIQEEESNQEININNIQMYYIDPSTGERLPDNKPSEVEASDGTKMIGGVIKIDDTDILRDEGLVDKIIDRVLLFINSNAQINVTKDNLRTDMLDKGIVSFVMSPSYIQANSNRTVIIAAVGKIDDARVNREVEKFFNKFPITDDFSDFNIPKANQEIAYVLEKVAVNLSKAEKNRIKSKIRSQLAKNDITLTYLEQ